MSGRRTTWTIGLSCVFLLISVELKAGVDEGMARYVPWSGSYWPICQGLLIRGPLNKYDRATGHRAASWEMQQNPPRGDMPTWFGYCHAWAAAAVTDREPIRTRNATDIRGAPIWLGIGDQKGMLTACHTDDQAQHYGIRYDGEPGDDRQDIYPDELWRVLRLYIKQRGIPLIMDTEGGTEVWNYPVYAYRVFYQPTGRGTLYSAEMSLWMADDAVPPDIVGVQVSKQTYYFTFQLQGGSAQLGSGRWVGPSLENHPDFAWYPYIARAENPEMEYDKVKRLVDASGSGPTGSDVPANRWPSGPTHPSAMPNVGPGASGGIPLPPNTGRPGAGGGRLPPNVVPGTSGRMPPPPNVVPGPSTGGVHPLPGQPYVLSPVELLSLIVNKKSQFTLDVTVNKFDGGQYAPDEVFSIKYTSAKAGYLYLLYLDSQGQLSVLYPPPRVDNRISGRGRFQLPDSNAGYVFRTHGALGTHRIKAVVTTMPLVFSGLAPTAPSTTGPLGPAVQVQRFHLPPSQTKMLKSVLGRYQRSEPIGEEELGGASPQVFLGQFGQDEVAFYVGPSASSEVMRD